MKKALKITTVCLIMFALITNIYSAIFSYYGVKSNSLPGQLMAQSSSNNPDDGGGGSDLGGNGDYKYWRPNEIDVECTGVTYTMVNYYNSNGGLQASVGYNANGIIASLTAGSTSGASGSSTSMGQIGSFYAKKVQCPSDQTKHHCRDIAATQACR